MFKKIVPISLKEHSKTKVKPITNFDFVKDLSMASVMAHEFSTVAPIYPIVFIKDPNGDVYRPVALFGFQQGENLFAQGSTWKATYIPAIIRRYPFVLAGQNDSAQLTVCMDVESELVNESEGQALFTEDGKPTEAIEQVKKYLQELHGMELFTREFTRLVAELDLLTPLQMSVRIGTEVKNVTGAFFINEERMGKLSDKQFLDLRKKNLLPLIYSHLSSLGQIQRLVQLKDASLGLTTGVDQSAK